MKKTILISSFLLATLFLMCKSKTNNDDLLDLKQYDLKNNTETNKIIIEYKKIDEILFDSSYALKSLELLKNKNKYKLKLLSLSNNEIESFSFETNKKLKELFFCDNKLNQDEHFITVLDNLNESFKSWSLLNKRLVVINIEFECMDYEPEESFD